MCHLFLELIPFIKYSYQIILICNIVLSTFSKAGKLILHDVFPKYFSFIAVPSTVARLYS